MRRFLLLTVFGVLCFTLLGGCGGSEPTTEKSTEKKASRVPQK